MSGNPWRALPLLLLLSAGLIIPPPARGQWKSRLKPTPPELLIFHSTMVGGLPTAETIAAGDLEFEVTHRFRNALGTGFDNFFGLDFGANTRIALGYGVRNNLMLALGRSSIYSNFDLWLKYRFWEWPEGSLPGMAAIRLGVAWNSKPVVRGRSRTDARNFQLYAQAVLNLRWQRVALGLVPGWLYNTSIRSPHTESSTTLGAAIQWYPANMWSLWTEAVITVAGLREGSNALSFGLELETGGHFFKIFLSNSNRPNPSQYLAGATFPLSRGSVLDHLVFGFTITRLLSF